MFSTTLRAAAYISRLVAGNTVRQLNSLVIVEHKNGAVSSGSISALNAAKAIGGTVSVLVAGSDVQAVASKAAQVDGVSEVLVADHPVLEKNVCEPYAALLKEVHNKNRYTHLVAASTSFGKDLFPRVAAELGVQPLTDVVQIVDPNTYVRPIYAGNALSTVKYVHEGVHMVLVRPSNFPSTTAQQSNAKIVQVGQDALAAVSSLNAKAKVLGQEVRVSERPELGSARVVVCGGRPLKNAENFKMLESLADVLGGAVGASRAAVDAGWVPNDLQVGQTGKVIAPDLYIGVGISGAIQHLAGMKDSKVIVAINSDPEAPIFQVADYGMTGDLYQIIPELEAALRKALAK